MVAARSPIINWRVANTGKLQHMVLPPTRIAISFLYTIKNANIFIDGIITLSGATGQGEKWLIFRFFYRPPLYF